jgi:ADP-ribosyl-[dinitrogen reductase] hydrolase
MALCLAESLIERGGFDARDQMTRYPTLVETGQLSSTTVASTSATPVVEMVTRFDQQVLIRALCRAAHTSAHG